jgi:hypothetical protein
VVLSKEGRSPRGRNLSTGKASPKWEPEAKAIISRLPLSQLAGVDEVAHAMNEEKEIQISVRGV